MKEEHEIQLRSFIALPSHSLSVVLSLSESGLWIEGCMSV